MKEIYLEETSKVVNEETSVKIYKILTVLKYLSYVLSGVWIYVCLFFDIEFVYEVHILVSVIVIFVVVVIPFALFILLGLFLNYLSKKAFSEYDYIQSNEIFTISRITNNSKRKQIIKFSNVEIEKIGKVRSETYEAYLSIKKVKILNTIATGKKPNDKNLYYLVVNKAEEKFLIKLDVTYSFIKSITLASSNLLLEKDFK
ncbi:MAG: hypothetical protein IKW33_04645 [Clostridia bacterium]|nr:hypothetical protein [Clostridia bacterium]